MGQHRERILRLQKIIEKIGWAIRPQTSGKDKTMKQNKIYPHKLQEKGFKELSLCEMSECQFLNSMFVERYISPTVKYADSGWKGVEYAAYSNGEEYVFFLNDNCDRCRGICVTADSKQAIATAVFDNID